MQLDERTAYFNQLAKLINTLFLLCKHLSLYDAENKLVVATTARLQLFLEELFAQGQQVNLVVARHGFLCDGEFIQRSNKQFEKFALRMFEHGVASLTLTPALTTESLHAFLRVLLRRPSESWDEGGISHSLSARQVVGVVVEELSAGAFRLTEQGAADQQFSRDKSDLWDRFALSIAHTCGEAGDALLEHSGSPGSFATTVGQVMASKTPEEKLAFTKELSRFLSSLQHENIQIYQAAALGKLADFINNLSGDLREMFMRNVFNLRLKGDYAEGFFSELSDEVILAALKNVSLQKNYVPPVLMSVIGKLAGERNLASPEQLAQAQGTATDATQKIQELFRPDEFHKYVPDRYQKALMKVLRSEAIPTALDEHLTALKQSLENTGIAEHAANITLHILHHHPDAEQLEGLRENLYASVEFYLEVGDYASLSGLCRLCFVSHRDGEHLQPLRDLLGADSFTQRLLRAARQQGKQDYAKIGEVIGHIGEPFILPLLDQMEDEANRNVRLFYLGCLKQLGDKVAVEAAKRLQDERWFVVRNILYLLNELDAESALAQVRPLMKHSHPKVRQEALKFCVRLHDKSADGILISGLEADDDNEVLNAIVLLPFSASPRVIDKLIELLTRNELLDYHLETKKAAIRTLAGMQVETVLPTFSELLSSRSLLHPICHAELKREIVGALGKFPVEQVRQILTEQVASGSKELAQQAEAVLARLEGASHDR